MKTTVELTGDELEEAILEYVGSKGLIATSPIRFWVPTANEDGIRTTSVRKVEFEVEFVD